MECFEQSLVASKGMWQRTIRDVRECVGRGDRCLAAPRSSPIALCGPPPGVGIPYFVPQEIYWNLSFLLLTVLFGMFCDQLLNHFVRIVSQGSFKKSCTVRVIDRQAAAF